MLRSLYAISSCWIYIDRTSENLFLKFITVLLPSRSRFLIYSCVLALKWYLRRNVCICEIDIHGFVRFVDSVLRSVNARCNCRLANHLAEFVLFSYSGGWNSLNGLTLPKRTTWCQTRHSAYSNINCSVNGDGKTQVFVGACNINNTNRANRPLPGVPDDDIIRIWGKKIGKSVIKLKKKITSSAIKYI